MKRFTKHLIRLSLITLLVTALSGCGLFGRGPRDGGGPKRDGSGGGPCNWFSSETNSFQNRITG